MSEAILSEADYHMVCEAEYNANPTVPESEKFHTPALEVRATCDGEILDRNTDITEGDEYEELDLMTYTVRRAYPGRTNVVVQLIRGENVEAENNVNPAPAYS